MPVYQDVVALAAEFLRAFDAAVAVDMASVVTQPLPPGTDLIDFTFDFDCRKFHVTRFAMTFGAGQLTPNFYLLQKADTTLPPALASAVGEGDDDDRNGARGFRDKIVGWLADHWARADGLNLPIPAYACQHDDLGSYDLRRRAWIDDADKWD